MESSRGLRAAILSLLFFAAFIAVWQIAAGGSTGGTANVDPEYAKLIGKEAASGSKSAMPTPLDVARKFWSHLADPF